MAFVPRKSKINNTEEEREEVVSAKVENFADTILETQISRKTYIDLTIETLEYLESKGINIYDKNRVGGMYQRRDGLLERIRQDNLIKELSTARTTTKTSDENKEDFEALLAFAKSINK